MSTQDLDGVLMVMNASMPEQERELEALYMNFAQPASLTIKQCLTLGLQVSKDGSLGLGGWGGEAAQTRTCMHACAYLHAIRYTRVFPRSLCKHNMVMLIPLGGSVSWRCMPTHK